MKEITETLQAQPSPYVVLGVGVPGSGKTTVLRDVSQELALERICPDEIRAEMTGSEADQSRNKEVWDRAYARAATALASGNSCVIDATHAEAFRRPDQVRMYREFGARAVIAVKFELPLAVAVHRNANRDRVVPEHVLQRMHDAIQQNPPSTDEGFDMVLLVNNEEDHQQAYH